MAPYENGYVKRLAEGLRKQGVAPETRERILEGADEIGRSASREERSAWFAGAMARMDAELDPPTRQATRERCACCLGGKRLTLSRAIARDHETLEERIAAANEARFVFGHSVGLAPDGTVLVQFQPDGWPEYPCPCIARREEPISVTYCYCCAGHVKHHLQIALGRKVEMTVLSSAAASGGGAPCRFSCRLVE